MKKCVLFVLGLFFLGNVYGTPMSPSIGGTKGLYHLIAADNGYPGIFFSRMCIRIFTSDLKVYYPYDSLGTMYIDSSGKAVDSYFGGDFDFSFSMAFTKWLEISSRFRYKADFIDCADGTDPVLYPSRSPERPVEWYYNGHFNRASIDRGDLDIGVKLIPTRVFALYPFVSIPIGTDRDTTFYDASYFGKATVSNRGGVFRYFTNGMVAPGGMLLLSGSTSGPSPLSGYLNAGYQYKDKASEIIYGVGSDILFFDFFDPYVEFWGNRRLQSFGDDLPSYITLGFKFIGTGISADIAADFLVIGKREYAFTDFIPDTTVEASKYHVATGWGMRPTWAVNIGIGFAYDFYKMQPVTNKGMLTGRVIDAVTKKGIDAIITATRTPKTVSEPGSGVYDADVSAGKVRVTVTKDGYNGDSKFVTVERGEKAVLDFELMPQISKSALVGRVIDKWSTLPVNNAKITVLSAQKMASVASSSYKPTEITTTIKGEEYRLNVNTGKWEKIEAADSTSKGYEVAKLIDSISMTNKEGLYKLDSLPSGRYVVTAEYPDYITQSSPIVCKPGETEILNFELLAEKIILYGVHFEFDSSRIFVDSYILLDKIVSFLNENSGINVEIGGHTDWVADDEYNMDLSQRRAESVRRYLIAHGISPKRITAKGYGEAVPIADNATDEGRALNRRIELKILRKK
ncbi:MAG: OmpA family protein [bacterium]|nr:OmpA family protein [bacterium]